MLLLFLPMRAGCTDSCSHFLWSAIHSLRAAVFAAAFCGALAGCMGSQDTASTVDATEDLPIDRAALCLRIDRVLDHAQNARRLNSSDHAAWQIVHGILAFGNDFQIEHNGSTVCALDYLLGGGTLTGWTLRKGDVGVIAVLEGGSKSGQGHPDQWLGYLSQCALGGISPHTPLVVGGHTFTVLKLLDQAKHDITSGQEATWTLMALSAYLPSDTSWIARDGSEWTVERVAEMESQADLAASPCGGTHRLYGLVSAVNHYLAETKQKPENLSGGWAKAENTIQHAIESARRYQQADGSFSTSYLERASTSADVFAKLGATGHIFEFLVLTLDNNRLTEPWVDRAAHRLVTLLEQTQDLDVECGALYHAAHGLLLYRERLCTKDLSNSLGSPL
jgi:hypothetical protein